MRRSASLKIRDRPLFWPLCQIGLSAFGMAILLGLNWYGASVRHQRLCWYFVANSTLDAGVRLTRHDVDGRFGFLPVEQRRDWDYISNASRITGAFSQEALYAGERIRRKHVGPHPILENRRGTAIVPVEVKASTVTWLRPGMRIVLARGKLANPITVEPTTAHRGYPIVSIVTPREPSPNGVATLLVRVPAEIKSAR